MTCTATVNVILPEHPVTGRVTEVVHCMRKTQCTDRHFGWVQNWIVATSVEWNDMQSGHTFEVIGSEPGYGTLDFITQEVETP